MELREFAERVLLATTLEEKLASIKHSGAQHRALTVTEEANIETDARAEWAEEAVNAAVCAWRKQQDAEAKARRDNLARQEEAVP